MTELWKTRYPLIDNIRYTFFWKPKLKIWYRNKIKERYSHGTAGYYLATRTDVFFTPKGTEKEIRCSFKLLPNGKTIIKTRRTKKLSTDSLSFSKSVKISSYWGQGGGRVRIFTYRVTEF